MNESSLVLLVLLGVIVVLAALLYAGRGYIAALTGVAELRATLSQIEAHTQT